MAIVTQNADLFELRNDYPVKPGEDPPTLLAEVGTWKTETGNQSGVSIEVFGPIAPLLSPAEARKFGKWLTKAADDLEGASKAAERKGQKKRREFEDEE